jgi:hypothetical protein
MIGIGTELLGGIAVKAVSKNYGNSNYLNSRVAG